MTVRSIDLVEQCLMVMYHLQGSHTSEDSMRLSSRSRKLHLIPKDFAAAKALSFEAGSTGSGGEGEEQVQPNGSAVFGPTTRKQWSEWVSKTPVTSPNGKENLEVGDGKGPAWFVSRA